MFLRNRVLIGLCLFIVVGLGAKLLRPISGDVFGLLGVAPNFGYAGFLTLLLARWIKRPHVAAFAAAAGLIAYELDQIRAGSEAAFVSGANRTFDPWDIVASAAGAGVAYLLLRSRPTPEHEVPPT